MKAKLEKSKSLVIEANLDPIKEADPRLTLAACLITEALLEREEDVNCHIKAFRHHEEMRTRLLERVERAEDKARMAADERSKEWRRFLDGILAFGSDIPDTDAAYRAEIARRVVHSDCRSFLSAERPWTQWARGLNIADDDADDDQMMEVIERALNQARDELAEYRKWTARILGETVLEDAQARDEICDRINTLARMFVSERHPEVLAIAQEVNARALAIGVRPVGAAILEAFWESSADEIEAERSGRGPEVLR